MEPSDMSFNFSQIFYGILQNAFQRLQEFQQKTKAREQKELIRDISWEKSQMKKNLDFESH